VPVTSAPPVQEPLTLERLPDGLAVLRLKMPGKSQNILSSECLKALASLLDELETACRDPAGSPTGLVLESGLQGSFCAGADVSRLDAIWDLSEAEVVELCDRGRRLFHRITQLPIPSVAVIDGTCLGGGLELALACDFRICTQATHTSLGFPEVKLGLLPGWGGTVRLPRLIGLGAAVELACGGEPVNGPAAALLGLVDGCVQPEAARATAIRLVADAGRTRSHMARRRRMLEAGAGDPDEIGFLASTSAAVILGRTGGHYPAPPTILETMLRGQAGDAVAAGRLESEAFARLARSRVARQLVRVFRLGEQNRRDPGVASGGGQAKEVGSPAVVGAGIMGAGIAASHLRAGFSTLLTDVADESLARSVPGILQEAAWDRLTRRSDPTRALELAGRLRTSTSLTSIATADLVIESVIERADLKRQVLGDIEGVVGPDAIIATNTSTNPITRLAESLERPGRFCGMHFFNPVRRMTLVEVVRGPATTDATVAVVVAHAKRLGKCPIVVQDSPGFLVNRVLMPYLHEAIELVREGIDLPRIDRVAREFGMPMGPLELYDMIGIDTAFYAGLVMATAFGDRIEAAPVIPALVKAGRLGRKTGNGFYRYGSGGDQRARPVGPAEGLAELIEPYRLPARPTDDGTLRDRLFLPMLLEAVRTIDEGIVREARDVDLAVIHALGFPPFRGGLLAWGDSLGGQQLQMRIAALADIGPRMLPVPRLTETLVRGEPLTAVSHS
jgi:3-hydroxyacyl-CoA dehydrogenase/enoyl-CoA hydratase/carnithine racemase